MRKLGKIVSRWQEEFCVASTYVTQAPIKYIFPKKCRLHYRLPHEAQVHRQSSNYNLHLFTVFNSE